MLRKIMSEVIAEKRPEFLIDSIVKLAPKNGDIFILKTDRVLRPESLQNLRQAVKEMLHEWGFDVHVMILEEGTEISVMTKEEMIKRMTGKPIEAGEERI
jgi:hypothetical protein